MENQIRKPDPVTTTSADINEERMTQLRQLFPEAFTEGKVDFDKLRATLGDLVDDRPERYSFTWAGKQDAIRILQTPTSATLIPAPDESVDFNNTQNIFIEGDNLEVLKLLYKSYFGRVKMIYIDPPYNTGNDFIYPDNYADPLDTYLQLTGQKDAEGNLLSTNSDTSGRFHSAWLSMMYPRLFIARQLLHDDGVMFISINDAELPHLRFVMNEIFGEEQFVGAFVWKSRHNVDSRNKTGLSSDHEYILIYGKKIQGRSIDKNKYSNPDNDSRGPWMSDNMVGLASKEKRPNLHYDLIDPETGINYGCPEKGWRYNPATMGKKVTEGRVIWPAKPDGRPREKKFLSELKSQLTGMSSFLLNSPTTSIGTQELRSLFEADVFDFPKPVDLIKTIVEQGSSDGDIVLDFFAGACPTAQAVFESNRNDSNLRQFVLVQLPEPTEPGSPAMENGYKTIAEIGKERIRRVITKIETEDKGKLPLEFSEDLGFKVFKLAPTNFRAWEGTTEATPEEFASQMELFNDPLVDGWRPANVIYEIALKEGYSLNCYIQRTAVAGHEVYRVNDQEKDQHFYLCLENAITENLPAKLNLSPDDLFICRDISLDDTMAANLALQCRLKTI